MSSDELADDKSAQLQRQIAFYNTFYETEDGKDVLSEIRRYCYSSQDINLIAFYLWIRDAAGRTEETERAMIDAEAETIRFEKPEKENRNADNDE